MKAQIIPVIQNLSNTKFRISMVLLALLLLNPAISAQTTHTVLNGSDNGPGSFRQALSDSGPDDTIRFSTEVDTVFLSSGELLIDKSISITGNEDITCILRSDTTLQFRIFQIQSTDSLSVQFSNIAITGGHAPDGNDTIINGESGGGILVADSIHDLVFSNCHIYENHAGDGFKMYWVSVTGKGGNGGGIYSLSKVELYNCNINENKTGKGADASSGGNWDSQSAGSGGSGGGIYCLNDLFIENCVVNSNLCGPGGNAVGTTYSAGGNGGAGGGGGAIYCNSGMVHISNAIINNNAGGKGGNASNSQAPCVGGSAGNGGALLFSDARIMILASEINGNLAGNGGSGYGNESGSGKSGGNGGGIFALNCNINIYSTEIELNHTGSGGSSGGSTQWVSPGNGGAGGGIYLEKCYYLLEDCLISENYTGKGASTNNYYTGGGHGGSGGGCYIKQARDNSCIRTCRFEKNYTGSGGTFKELEEYTHVPVANGGSGGGLAINASDSLTRIINTVISGNRCGNAIFKTVIPPEGNYSLPRGGSGGGIYVNQARHKIINCTISNNKAGSSIIVTANQMIPALVPESVRGKGGGLFASVDSIYLINSIIARNYLGFDSIPNDIEGLSTLNYSLLSTDTLTEFSGTGNLVNVEPGFFNFPDSLFLAQNSLAINHGSIDTTGLFLPETDVAGNPRIYGDRIDMGAYEFQGEPQDQYIISTHEIVMDTIPAGGFSIDSLSILNYGMTPLIISSIVANAPFYLSIDKTNWFSELNNISIPENGPFYAQNLYIKFESMAPGTYSDSLFFFFSHTVDTVHLSGICKSSEGIIDYQNEMKLNVSPNPFYEETRITYYLEESGDVYLSVFHSSGVKVGGIKLEDQPAGINAYYWNRKSLPDGTYFIRIICGKKTSVAKLLLIS